MIKNQTISLSHFVVRNPGNIVSDMDGEKVMLSVQKGKYYNLGEIGGEIWDMIDSPVSVEQLVTTLIASYEVERADCEKQVISFLEHLAEEELIHLDR